MRVGWICLSAMLCTAVVACNGEGGPSAENAPGSLGPGGGGGGGTDGGSPSDGGTPARTDGGGGGSEVLFQPGYHQALRFSASAGSVTTYRQRVPVTRSGSRVRIALRAGDGTLTVRRAYVARAGSGGSLASTAVPVLFHNEPGFSAQARARTVSDPVDLAVRSGDELAVSFEAQGALAAGSIALLPGSYTRSGAYADVQGALGGSENRTALGLQTVEVEGPRATAVVAIGDSITEGYVNGSDDLRNAWPLVAARTAGVAVVDSGVSSQGVWDQVQYNDGEVMVLPNVTDCMVLLGTNNLASKTTDQITAELQLLYDRLAPVCRVWAATLLSKERTSAGDLATVLQRRKEVNAWIRTRARVAGVWDAEAALADPNNPDNFRVGMEEDQIHPSVAGQKLLGESAAAFLRDKGLAP